MFNIRYDLFVPYPDYAESGRLEIIATRAIVFLSVVVYLTIKFNDKLFGRVIEVHYELTDGMLSVKLITIQLPVPQMAPQAFLGRRLRLPEFYRSIGNILW